MRRFPSLPAGLRALGAAIARRLVTEGAKVTITDVQASAGRALGLELGCDFLDQDVTKKVNGVTSFVKSKNDMERCIFW